MGTHQTANSPVRLLAQGCSRVLEAVSERWGEFPVAITENPEAREQFLDHARFIYDLVLQTLESGRTANSPLVVEIAEARASQRIHPRHSIDAGILLHQIIVDTATDLLPVSAAGQEALRDLSNACLAVLSQILTTAAEAHLGALLKELSDSQAAERRRIARELHDQTGHGLAVAQRRLELMHLRLEQDATDKEVLLPLVDQAVESVVDTMRGVRHLLSGLREDEDITSLRGALRHLAETFPGNTTVRTQVQGDESHLSPTVLREVFLIVRESLRNAHRHAGASTVDIHAEIRRNRLQVRTVDNGIGIAPQQRAGSGMASMRERADLLGGRLEWVRPGPGGTGVLLTIPLTS